MNVYIIKGAGFQQRKWLPQKGFAVGMDKQI